MKSTETVENETVSKEVAVIPVKFGELQSVNPDVYAWITIPGTEIDYPILQHTSDNSYYFIGTIYITPHCMHGKGHPTPAKVEEKIRLVQETAAAEGIQII